MEWVMDVSFRGKQYLLKAEVEYKDEQIIKIRVHGLRGSILLETEYKLPVDGKLRWRYLEGRMTNYGHDTVRFQFDIQACLEYYIRAEIYSA
ncbi:hypothetical protein QWZ08_25050 [Ferruginibacter paludis]|uniref:hypothetical protein n=1 Tax=Ferruginibacter paludis TaxID=1310417 RepID=UPI0025B2EA25|nr:hypothetical protein [Ferruginibacter paludis]MDN3658936.1 hypothetical protein [Ferruginibacter paludis]